MSYLDPRIQETVEDIQNSIDKDFTVWVRYGNGEGCQLFNIKMGISIELSLSSDGNVEAQPMFSVPGFSGFVLGMKLCMPNEHLFKVICQLETIKYFLPKDNINDHYYEVVRSHVLKERRLRRELIKLLKEDNNEKS